MATIRYDQVPLTIHYNDRSETILAYNCALSEAADLRPVKGIGFKGTAEQTPQGARTASISFSYTPVLTGIVDTFLETTGSFNIINELASGLKTSKQSIASGVDIVFGGISGEGLLSSYSLSLAPYSPVHCDGNFELFGSGENIPVSGSLTATEGDKEEQSLAGTVGHSAYSSFMTSGSPATITSEDQTGIVQSVDYSLNFQYEPVYKLGKEFPFSFLYHSAEEEASITENVYQASGIAFTGKNENFHLNIKALDGSTAMQLKMDEPVLSNAQVSVDAGGLVNATKQIRSVY